MTPAIPNNSANNNKNTGDKLPNNDYPIGRKNKTEKWKFPINNPNSDFSKNKTESNNNNE
jgi:hypothetical protein